MTKITFQVYAGDKGEKKHSRRYGAEDKESPISDIYIKRPFANGKDKLIITISEK